MTYRTKIGKYYVERRKDGSIAKWTSVKRSARVDRAKRAIRRVKSGYGHKGDIRSMAFNY